MSSSKKTRPASSISASKKTSFSPTVSFILPADGGMNEPPTPTSVSSRSRLTPHSQSTTKRDSAHSINSSSYVPRRSAVLESPDSNSLLLLPPAQTIREALTALASTTASQLEDVWDEVGYNPEERASQLTDLLSEFRRLCKEKVAYEHGVAETFRQTIIDAKEEMRETSLALKVDVDETLLKEETGQPLQDELATLEASLENLRAAAQVAGDDLCSCRDKLLEAHEALGSQLEDTWQDVTSDLTQARREQFHKKLYEMEEVLSTRASAVVQLLKDCQELIDILKIDPEENSLDRKILGSLRKSNDGTITIKSNVESETCTGISSSALDSLTKRVSELNGEKRRRKARLAEMGADIGELWEKLHVPREEQRKFAESINGLGIDTIEKGEVELKRLHELKNVMMGKLILEARTRINELWEETNANDEQKSSIREMMSIVEANFTDEVLSRHEDYIKVLESRLEQMRPILVIIEKREAVIQERMVYEELQKDPERLQQRGSALTKQLMKEEKMSRRIKKDLPKYTDHLEKKLREWQENNNEPFLYKGKMYLEVIDQQEEEWQQYKDSQTQMKLKKKQKEKTSNNTKGNIGYQPLPGKKKIISVPLSQRNNSVASAPLSDGTNRVRAVSRGRALGPPKTTRTAAPIGKRDISAGRSRTISTGRSRPTTRP